MFDQILSLVKEQLENHPQVAQALPAGQAGEVHQEVAGNIVSSLQSSLSGGGLGSLSDLFSGHSSFSEIASSVSGNLIQSLTTKFNLDPAIAGNIAAAIPGILAKFGQQSNPAAGGEEGSNGGGILGSLGSLLGH
ncbi:hypothetical protein GA0116948_11153 [Chitinophaga costaii]|uniref:DUF937 domain-containing protein n=1 Tax=Chitinophaga costaii TaxID=1335309 RepID=A0A1C4F1M0_9BACT|nr:hypothetical protein [Chitinophaga costaii]PUZ22128.1 hypothetical protein DCM91_15510 [Chitinophaga costaii]SCC49999.1 hypothetical protein GA0116948_11153 [Chitinophaga costaii]